MTEGLSVAYGLLSCVSLLVYVYSTLIFAGFLLNIDLDAVAITRVGFRVYLPTSQIAATVLSWSSWCSAAAAAAANTTASNCPLIDGAAGAPRRGGCLMCSVAVNALAVLIFAAQHSGMARNAFKKFATAFAYDTRIERAWYITWSAAAILAMLHLWRPLPAVLLAGIPSAAAVYAIQALGVVLLVAASGATSGLLGYTQAWRGVDPSKNAKLVSSGVYSLVRHPMMASMCIVLLPATEYTLGRVMFVGSLIAYIVVAVVCFEEPSLQAAAPAYKAYAKKVQYRLFPGLF